MSLVIIDCNVTGLENLQKLYDKFTNNIVTIVDILADEAEIFIDSIRADTNVPKEYADALAIVEVPNDNKIIIFTEKTQDRWLMERVKRDADTNQLRFGTKVEWALYVCPRRKYYGGKLALQYTGPDYIKEKWAAYKDTFISKVKQRIIEALRG
jgi:electron transfer flavoprotein alpha subunit